MDPKPGTAEQIDMNAFRREMEELKQVDSDIHLPGMHVGDLTEFDAITWRKWADKTLTREEFNERRHEAVARLKAEDSRTLFYAYLGNSWYDHFGAPTI